MNSNYDYLSALYNRILQLENDLSILKEKSLFHKMFCPKCFRTIPIKDGHIPIITCENCDKDKVDDRETCEWRFRHVKDWGFANGYPVEDSYEYIVGCNKSSYTSTPEKLDYKFCPYCSKPIEEVNEEK